MKTLLFFLVGFASIALFSCANNIQIDDVVDIIENTDKNSDKTPNTTPTEPKVEPDSQKFTYGIDISKYQGDEMSLLSKKKDSLSFIICRSTEGVTYTDPYFYTNWETAKEKGFIRGAYHFYLSNDSPESQSANFLNAIKDLQDTDLPPIIDFEEESIAKGSNKEQVIENLWKFIFLIEEKSGRKPIIYTDVNIGNSYLTASRFANYTLWIANYTTGEDPTMPGAWEGMDWVLWQKMDNYHYDKVLNDFDSFNGSLADLKMMIAESSVK